MASSEGGGLTQVVSFGRSSVRWKELARASWRRCVGVGCDGGDSVRWVETAWAIKGSSAGCFQEAERMVGVKTISENDE